MSSVTTKSAADTVVFSAPAIDVHSAPSNKGVVATTNVLPTVQLGMKKICQKLLLYTRWIYWLLTLESETMLWMYSKHLLTGGGGGPTDNPAAGVLWGPRGQATKVEGEKDIRRKEDWKRDECQDEEEEQVQYLEVHLSNASSCPE